MSVVVDSSMALAWYFEDERNTAVLAVLARVARSGAVMPSLWRYEVSNSLQVAVRRNRIDAGYRDHILAVMSKLDIQIDPDSDDRAWSDTVQLSATEGLTVYDAAYVELARRRGLPLASLDAAMLRAARAAGVAVLA